MTHLVTCFLKKHFKVECWCDGSIPGSQGDNKELVPRPWSQFFFPCWKGKYPKEVRFLYAENKVDAIARKIFLKRTYFKK